jgi:ribosomal protein S18 acetylase RimI-like enzyme
VLMTEPAEVIMRTVESGDYEELVRFFDANSVPQVIRQFHPFPLSASTARYIARNKHLDRYYVAVLRGRIIALCMLRGWDDGYSTPSFGILVDHRFHARGIGRKMTEFAISEAGVLGCRQVRLSVYASNEVALRLYASLGFEERVRESVLVMGQPDEKIIMVKDLETACD